MRPVSPRLSEVLAHLLAAMDRGRLRRDPLCLVHRYADPLDQEVAGFIAAGLAFGRAGTILASAGGLLDALGPSPHAFAAAYTPALDEDRFRGFSHRWIKGPTIDAMFRVLGRMIREAGSLGRFVAALHDPRERNVRGLLTRFAAAARGPGDGGPASAFFVSPAGGSACKRLNLWLRWMARPRDGIDLGLFTFLSPDRLVVPLDAHVMAFARRHGLTALRTPGWAAAEDVTEALSAVAPGDPLKFDFAICHAGMAGAAS